MFNKCFTDRLIILSIFSYLVLGLNNLASADQITEYFERRQQLLKIAYVANDKFVSEEIGNKRVNRLEVYIRQIVELQKVPYFTAFEMEWIYKQIFISNLDLVSSKLSSPVIGNALKIKNMIESEIYQRGYQINSLMSELDQLNQTEVDSSLWLQKWNSLSPNIQHDRFLNRGFTTPFEHSNLADYPIEGQFLESVLNRFSAADILTWIDHGYGWYSIYRHKEYFGKIFEKLALAKLGGQAYCRTNIFLKSFIEFTNSSDITERDESVAVARSSTVPLNLIFAMILPASRMILLLEH